MMSQARSSLEPIRVKPSSSGPDKRPRPRTVFRLLLLCLGFLPAAGFADRPEQAKPSDVPCLECHDDVSARIEAGVHGRAGLTCIDCHAGLKGAADFPHPVRLNKADCLSCHTQRSQDSERSFHRPGRAAEGRPVLDCAGCHGRHDIRGAGDPQSRIHPDRLAETCGRCHDKEAGYFARIKIHDRGDAEAQILRVVEAFFIILIAALVLGFFFFVLADVLGGRSLATAQVPVSPFISEDESFERMSLGERVQHGAVIIAFVLLAVTGVPLLFHLGQISGRLTEAGSGIDLRGFVHRAAAVMLVAAAAAHIVSAAFTRRGRQMFHDMRPRIKDFRDAVQAFAYGLCLRRTPPLFDRYSFLEKFEYWSLVWGTLIMTVTGIFMWRVGLGLAVLPPWALSLCVYVHGYEAVLAVLAVLIHVYHRGRTSPMNRVWLNGTTTGRELRLRHPLDYQRIHREREQRRRL